MRAAGEELEAHTVVATSIGLRFATGDDWLVASLADQSLVTRVLLA